MSSCSDGDEETFDFSSCDEITENFKLYSGQDLECHYYYTLTRYENENYIELNSHCADLARPFVINENCVDICETDPYNNDSDCGRYLSGREVVEIILIEK